MNNLPLISIDADNFTEEARFLAEDTLMGYEKLQVYTNFSDIMDSAQSHTIDTIGLISKMVQLFIPILPGIDVFLPMDH